MPSFLVLSQVTIEFNQHLFIAYCMTRNFQQCYNQQEFMHLSVFVGHTQTYHFIISIF